MKKPITHITFSLSCGCKVGITAINTLIIECKNKKHSKLIQDTADELGVLLNKKSVLFNRYNKNG